MNKKAGIIIAGLIIIIGIGYAITRTAKQSHVQLPTFFSYSTQELAPLSALSSRQEIIVSDLYTWDEKAFERIINTKSLDVDAAKFYTYLAIAERDFAHLSYNQRGAFSGNLSIIARRVFCEFFPTDCSIIFISGTEDEYSRKLAEIVMAKITGRITADEAQVHPYPAKVGSEFWDGKEPMIGRTTGSWLPWTLERGDQFRVSTSLALNSAAFKEQLTITERSLKNISLEQRRAVVFWAGGPGTKTPPGIWLNILDEYLKDKQISIETALNARAALSAAMMDAFIGCFDSKYTYWVRRPFMVNRTIQTVMPTPNHPSYPAGHACVSGAAKTVLSYFFPEDEEYWQTQAGEAANSRVWGGIHYSIDNQAGLELGERVGKVAIGRIQK